MIACAVKAMQPDGQLAERWEEFKGKLLNWAERREEETPQGLYALRMMLEQVRGDNDVGEMLVATTKLGLSAVLTAVPNIYVIVLRDRDPMHDDVAPLVEKGINLLHRANQTDPFDPVVRVDYDIEDVLERRKEEHIQRIHEQAKKDWVSRLIEDAVRPEAQN